MNSQITILDPVARPAAAKTLLTQDGFTCTLLTLSPRAEVSWPRPAAGDKQLLVALEGEVTVRNGSVNTVLTKDQAMLLRGNEDFAVVATSESATPVKILRIDVPPRQDPGPSIVGFDR